MYSLGIAVLRVLTPCSLKADVSENRIFSVLGLRSEGTKYFRSPIFWVATRFISVEARRCFGETFSLHLQDGKAKQETRKWQSEMRIFLLSHIAVLIHSVSRLFLFGSFVLFFDPEDGSNIFYRNIIFFRY
jgi:hypothetical protein